MAKNKKNDVEVITPDNSKVDKKATKASKNKKPSKEKGAGLVGKVKESVSEIKKVSWPTFGKTCKQTGMVISVVAVCTLLLFGVDRLLGWLFTLIAY